MKQFVTGLFLLMGAFAISQEQFAFTEEGLTPQSISTQIDNDDLYTKASQWITDNAENYKLKIVDTLENKSIQFTMIKGNATSIYKQFYNVRYTINLSFEDNQFTFKPKVIDLKLNSKYDMGWKSFDLNDTTEYFKRGKPIGKYKAYLKNIIAPMNTLYFQLSYYLKNN